jgi:Rrf2 family protein
MKLTRTVGYAIAILLRIQHEGGGPVTAARIARGCRFPPRFLYRVLRRLVDAGLLRAVSGPGGGYALARPARRITLWQIVAAIEGPQPAAALIPVTALHKRAIRAVNALNLRQATRARRELSKISLAGLARL